MTMLPSLTELANKYGTDKGTVGPTDSWPAHNYTDVYGAYLEHLRHEPINLLEIGLGVTGKNREVKIVQGRNTGGASIKMWHEYFPAANIYGIDINPSPYLDNERLKTFEADQGSVESITQFLAQCGADGFDVIVDDGSHLAEHQQISFGALFPQLKSGGYYFIEDLLNNGVDGRRRPAKSPASVLCTRAVMKHFAEKAAFPQPHAIGNADAVAKDIAAVSFHCPAWQVPAGRSASWFARSRSPQQPGPKYSPDKEKLCLIRKHQAKSRLRAGPQQGIKQS